MSGKPADRHHLTGQRRIDAEILATCLATAEHLRADPAIALHQAWQNAGDTLGWLDRSPATPTNVTGWNSSVETGRPSSRSW